MLWVDKHRPKVLGEAWTHWWVFCQKSLWHSCFELVRFGDESLLLHVGLVELLDIFQTPWDLSFPLGRSLYNSYWNCDSKISRACEGWVLLPFMCCTWICWPVGLPRWPQRETWSNCTQWVWLLVANLPQWKMCDKNDFWDWAFWHDCRILYVYTHNIYLICILCLCSHHIYMFISRYCVFEGIWNLWRFFLNMTAHWHPDSLQGDASHSHVWTKRCWEVDTCPGSEWHRFSADRICLEVRIYLSLRWVLVHMQRFDTICWIFLGVHALLREIYGSGVETVKARVSSWETFW